MEDRQDLQTITGEYPPREHMLRDLMVTLEFRGKHTSVVRAPVVKEVCTDQGGMQVGVMATLIDVLGGALAVRAVYPDWIATADLSLHTTGRARSGRVSALGSILREGKTTVVIRVDIRAEEDGNPSAAESIGSSLITFSRLPQRQDTPELDLEMDEESSEAFQFGIDGPGLRDPYLQKAGMRILDEAAGVVELDLNDYVRNSFGSLQGGMVAILADQAGQLAARQATGMPMTTCDMEIHFLSQGKRGPFRTRTEVLRKTQDTVLTRVEITDTGAGDRLITVVMNTATLDP